MPEPIETEEITVEPWHDFGEGLAELIGERIEGQGPTSYIQAVTGGRNRDPEATFLLTDHIEFLSDLGDLVAKHYPDETPDRERFSVESFSIGVNDVGTVEISVAERIAAE